MVDAALLSQSLAAAKHVHALHVARHTRMKWNTATMSLDPNEHPWSTGQDYTSSLSIVLAIFFPVWAQSQCISHLIICMVHEHFRPCVRACQDGIIQSVLKTILLPYHSIQEIGLIDMGRTLDRVSCATARLFWSPSISRNNLTKIHEMQVAQGQQPFHAASLMLYEMGRYQDVLDAQSG